MITIIGKPLLGVAQWSMADDVIIVVGYLIHIGIRLGVQIHGGGEWLKS
jgi:hypothetical protein